MPAVLSKPLRAPKGTVLLTKAELAAQTRLRKVAWAAGTLLSDGSFELSASQAGLLTWSQSLKEAEHHLDHPSLLDNVNEIFGGTGTIRLSKAATDTQNAAYELALTSHQSALALKEMMPFMGLMQHRQDQAAIFVHELAKHAGAPGFGLVTKADLDNMLTWKQLLAHKDTNL